MRCAWSLSDPLYLDYHDNEWGVPLHDDQKLFEFLLLEGVQAGLSWITILRKRENYRIAFDYFDPYAIARYGKRKIAALMRDQGIVRNQLKIEAAIANARAAIAVSKEFGTLDRYLWEFVGGRPRVSRRRTLASVPARTAQSDAMSRDMMRRGFKFVGSTICYALMQATGMVNDHLVECFRYAELIG
jgi:DNA-3-methyladenine glycosylase I